MFVKEGRLAHASFVGFPPWWHDVFRDALVLVQEGKIACTSFLPQCNDVV